MKTLSSLAPTSDPLRAELIADPSLRMHSPSNKRATLMVNDSSVILKRFHFLQRECSLAQAGWTPGTLHWETKILWPEWVWQDALIATELRDRVLELRYPERRVVPGEDEAFLKFWRHILRDAPSDVAFARAISTAIKPFLREVYLGYLELTDLLDDAPTIRILRQAIRDIDEQGERMVEATATSSEVYRAEELQIAENWAEQIRQALREIGAENLLQPQIADPLPTLVGSIPFKIARTGRRDPRFMNGWAPWPDLLDLSRRAGEGLFELQVRQAQAHLNEIWAAEMASAVIFDLADEAPPEFFKDAARWCFDEIRHCRMGYTRFLEWGFQMNEMPMGSFSYDIGEPLDAVTRLGIIFYFETTFIHTKSERTKSFANLGDRTGSHDMDFDWADELIHTSYGKKWLEYFIEAKQLKLTSNEVKLKAENAVSQGQLKATNEDRRRADELRIRTLERARDLSSAQLT